MSLKDYTLATKLDSNGRWTVTANKIIVNRIQRNDVDQYLAFDEGIGGIADNFTHRLKFTITESTGGFLNIWCVSNILDEITPMSDALYARWGGINLILFEVDGGTSYIDIISGLNLSTPYYPVFDRDIGIGSFGQLQLLLYSDESETTLIGTATLGLHADVDWRYLFGNVSTGSGATVYISGDIENLNIDGIVVAGAVIPRRRMEGY